jgi:sulfonate transport system substrate-binding protein
MPAYVAYEKGFFNDEGIQASLTIEPTAWMVPHKMIRGESQFAVMPWTRVAAAEANDIPLVMICGSGYEEAAIVVRKEINPSDVKKIAIPQRGGIKDLTAMGLIESLGWKKAELIRQPSGDGAIISLFGQGADAASMVEPYATMMESLGIGKVLKRTGDIWAGAPGCSLTTTVSLKESNPSIVQGAVTAFVRGASYVKENPVDSSRIAAQYIGVNETFIIEALRVNQPQINAIRNQNAMDAILSLMKELGYLKKHPENYIDLTFLNNTLAL